jgi:hypothetical protein
MPRGAPCRTPSRGGGTQELVGAPWSSAWIANVAAAQLPQARGNEIPNPDQYFREMNGNIVGNISLLCLKTAVGNIT